ncbi:hypothetical protein [Pseudoalteromonas virus vB_PspP-H6/1]|nr:hypothetical protein [Pseudoalteromonas virus vB_PspP-H6/1]
MAVLTFTQADGLYTTDVVAQTNDFSVEGNLLKADSIPASNDARILFNSQSDGTFSVDVSTLSVVSNNVGLVFRAVDVDNDVVLFSGNKEWSGEFTSFTFTGVDAGTNVEYYAYGTGGGAGLQVGVTE